MRRRGTFRETAVSSSFPTTFFVRWIEDGKLK
jgi:hypothetical protein